MKSLLLLITAVVAVYHVEGWSENFDIFPCYVPDFSERMPNTLDNLLGIVEEYEHREGIQNLDEMAEMIVKRYRKDGILFDPSKRGHQWYIGDDNEANKQKLLDKILQQSRTFPQNSFDPRTECGLHLMVSHSLDSYPHSGVDDIWDGSINRNNKNDRNKRSISSVAAQQSSSSNKEQQSSSSYSSSSNSRHKRSFNPSVRAASSNTVPDGVEPAVHPLENGVIETPYGPVAAGTLLSGLSSIFNKNGYSISSIMGDDADYMPSEMRGKTIIRPYAASLAGDIAQLGLISDMEENVTPEVGPSGRYNNCTTCAQLFSLENNHVTYLSRAELFAGLDVLIIYTAIHNNDNNVDGLTLSQILRHYYSEKGLPSQPQVKACNRLQLYKSIDREKLLEQALHFTYAYQDSFATHQTEVEINSDNFAAIEQFYTGIVTDAMTAMENFINSYNYDDEGYNPCFFGGDQSASRFGYTSLPETPVSETMADIIAIYAEEGNKDDFKNQRQLIGDIGRRMGVSQYRSRLGVISGRNGAWLHHMSNISNIGDWACNFTNDEETYGGSKSDMLAVFDTLSSYYHYFYSLSLQDLDVSSGRSQVVLWQVTSNFQTDQYITNRTIATFRESYPDVNIVFVGKTESPYEFLKDYEDDFISVSGKNYDEVLIWSLSRIRNAPRFFIYPACNPDNSSMTSNYREESHVYEGYVYPNYTTFITIPPQNFLYSRRLTVKVRGDVRVCFSRTNRYALENYHVEYVNVYRYTDTMDETLVCVGGPQDEEDEEISIDYMCSSRYVSECNPLHMSISAIGLSNSVSSCNTDNKDGCEYANQIQYEVMHDGMLCSGTCNLPVVVLLLLPTILQYFFN